MQIHGRQVVQLDHIVLLVGRELGACCPACVRDCHDDEPLLVGLHRHANEPVLLTRESAFLLVAGIQGRPKIVPAMIMDVAIDVVDDARAFLCCAQPVREEPLWLAPVLDRDAVAS